MILVLIVVIAVVALMWASKRRSAKLPVGPSGAPVDQGPTPPVWPSTTIGRLAVGALGFALMTQLLLLPVPFLAMAALLAAVVLSGMARFRLHDGSAAVLVVWVAGLAIAIATLLFLAGEVFIGHE